jgi:hypothetical protein
VGSNWIWEKASYTLNTLLALRKDFEPPFGKSLIATEIIMTASTFTLYMNGEIFGQNSPHNAWQYASRYCVDLQPSLNMFAATSSSVNTDDAIIGAIRVTYDDFTTDDLIGIRYVGRMPIPAMNAYCATANSDRSSFLWFLSNSAQVPPSIYLLTPTLTGT